MTDSSNILLLKVTSPQTLPPALGQALASLQGNQDESGWIRLQHDEPWEEVLRIVCSASLPPQALVTVYCQLLPDPGGKEYRRLWDRTEDLASALAAWSAGMSNWPRLQPGELVRLTPGGLRE